MTSYLSESSARPLPIPLTSAGAGSLSSRRRPRWISAHSRIRHVQQRQRALGCKLFSSFDRFSIGQKGCYEVSYLNVFCGATRAVCWIKSDLGGRKCAVGPPGITFSGTNSCNFSARKIEINIFCGNVGSVDGEYMFGLLTSCKRGVSRFSVVSFWTIFSLWVESVFTL